MIIAASAVFIENYLNRKHPQRDDEDAPTLLSRSNTTTGKNTASTATTLSVDTSWVTPHELAEELCWLSVSNREWIQERLHEGERECGVRPPPVHKMEGRLF